MENEEKSEAEAPAEKPAGSDVHADAPVAASGPRIKLHYIFFSVVATAAVAGAVLPVVLDGMQTKIQHWIVYALLPFMIWMIFASRKKDADGN